MAQNRDADLFGMCLFAAYLGELLALYKAQAIVRRLRAMGRDPVFPRGSRIMAPLARGDALGASPTIAMLRKGYARPTKLRRFVRNARDFLLSTDVPRRPISALDTNADIVTVAIGEMILQHAAAIEDDVYFVRLDDWFSPLNSTDEARFDVTPNNDLVASLIEISAEAFNAGGEPLEPQIAGYLREWIEQAGFLADRYVSRLVADPKVIPRRLWRGTGGHLFGRLLSYACHQVGGTVTGHDHAHGQGMFASISDIILEHPGCDTFMVWSKTQQRMSLSSLRPDFTLQERPPVIAVVPGKFRPKIDAPRSTVRSELSPIRRIMYVGTLYNDEFGPLTPLIPDLVLIDWEVRLISHLIGWGYEVLVKPHPESRVQSVHLFSELGARVIVGRFEEVYTESDLAIFGQPNATSFFSILGTGHPVVVADTGLHMWQPEALEMLKRRCGFVASTYTPENRLDTDWDKLRTAIDAAPKLSDSSLSQSYFNNGANCGTHELAH
jgi:hypothetical protein